MAAIPLIFNLIATFVLVQLMMFELTKLSTSFQCKAHADQFLEQIKSCGRILAYEKNLQAAFLFLQHKGLQLDASQLTKDLFVLDTKKQFYCQTEYLSSSDFTLISQNSSYKETTNWVYKFNHPDKEVLFCN